MHVPYIESDDDGAVPGGLVLNPLLAIRLEVPPRTSLRKLVGSGCMFAVAIFRRHLA